MKLIYRYLCLPVAIVGLCSAHMIPAIAQGGDGDETTCGIGLREAYFRTYHYSIWVCKDAQVASRLIFVMSPLGRKFQQITARKSGDNYTAIANGGTFIINKTNLEIRQTGKTVVQEAVLEFAGREVESTANCDSAIRATMTKLRNVRNTRNVRFRPYKLQGYANPPRANSDLFNFTFSGMGGENIMNSPKLLLSLSKQLMRDCPTTDAAKFGIAETDYYTMFGKLGNQVQRFKCVAAGVPARNGLQWGEFACP
ncbi:hypothetical protein IQ266_10110 [filamentous cyanobacterium LEGE 11480]|uniref:Uncharacterized protein n=1 Tax=Romeriopsis navalis LEGE 11480 TaxID=2777977 RepID=A0A928VK62_9CYAN|nr:hypothetical protein [Romeriopsis navalis]MBE9030081.1 hypothetical protein [Romeriopsis navalis LEGE 11480]